MKNHQFASAARAPFPSQSYASPEPHKTPDKRRYWAARLLEVAVVTTLVVAAVGLVGCKEASKAGGANSGANSGASTGSGSGSSMGSAPAPMPSDASSAPPNTAPKP